MQTFIWYLITLTWLNSHQVKHSTVVRHCIVFSVWSRPNIKFSYRKAKLLQNSLNGGLRQVKTGESLSPHDIVSLPKHSNHDKQPPWAQQGCDVAQWTAIGVQVLACSFQTETGDNAVGWFHCDWVERVLQADVTLQHLLHSLSQLLRHLGGCPWFKGTMGSLECLCQHSGNAFSFKWFFLSNFSTTVYYK